MERDAQSRSREEPTRASLSLAGRWSMRLDPNDVGLRNGWHRQTPEAYADSLQLPGSIQAQGFGNVPSERTQWTASLFDPQWFEKPAYVRASDEIPMRLPFFLLPEREYVGAAWFCRSIDLPTDWAGRRVELMLERPHWQTQLWIDGINLGSDDSLGTPHRYQLPMTLSPGRHTLVIRVDNRLHIDVGRNAHSVTDHTQTNWNGIIGELSLTATAPVWLADVQIFGGDPHQVAVRVEILNATGRSGEGVLHFDGQPFSVSWSESGGTETIEVVLENAEPWDEFAPNLRTANVSLQSDAGHDSVTVSYGVRRFEATGTQLRINGRTTFLRGTLECCIFPRTGYPPTDVESWTKVYEACRSHGLNHVRFHSWCPPRAAFVAADHAGIYCQIECGVWANHDGLALGDGGAVDEWLPREARRILREYGNHPSFVLFAHGNEPAGRQMKPYLAALVANWRQRDPRRLYAGATGWASTDEDEFLPVMRVWEKIPARGRGGWSGGDYRDAVAATERPVVSHEIGQHCVYPVFAEEAKYDGHLHPTNYAIFRDSLAAVGMLDQADDFVAASGALQTLCYKEDIEAALRTPGMGGFQLLGLSDFPGQGTALIGVLDAFWEQKGYTTPEQFRRFCGPTVPLVRLPSRLWSTSQSLIVEAEVAHFGAEPLPLVSPTWRLERADDHAVLAKGQLPARDIPVGNGTPLGRIVVDLAPLPAPAQLRLVLTIKEANAENAWDIWLYDGSTEQPLPQQVRLAAEFSEAEADFVESGGRLFLLPSIEALADRHPHGSFIPVFWNRLLMKDQPGQTLGLLCDPGHPALAGFPTAAHADWQWEDLCDSARYLVLDTMPRDLRPIVQPIDDWNTNRRLGLLFECQVGRGRVLVCTADLSRDLANRPAARQLYRSLTKYLHGQQLPPAVDVAPAALADLVRSSRSAMKRATFDPSMVPMTETES